MPRDTYDRLFCWLVAAEEGTSPVLSKRQSELNVLFMAQRMKALRVGHEDHTFGIDRYTIVV
mgnify:FL=1